MPLLAAKISQKSELYEYIESLTRSRNLQDPFRGLKARPIRVCVADLVFSTEGHSGPRVQGSFGVVARSERGGIQTCFALPNDFNIFKNALSLSPWRAVRSDGNAAMKPLRKGRSHAGD